MTSGTYNREVRKAERIILFVLGKMGPSRLVRRGAYRRASFTERNGVGEATTMTAEHREQAETLVRRTGAEVCR